MSPLRTHNSSARSSRGLAALAVAAAALALGAPLASASGSSPVVPPGGTIDGEGYGYWSGAANAAVFDWGGNGSPCLTIRAPDGGTVAYPAASGSCDVAAGEPIFIPGAADECSTYEGDHSGFGTTPAQLEACAREGFQSLNGRGSATVDGSPVADFAALTSASPPFNVVVPDPNQFGLTPGPGITARYGEGVLLQGFSPGTHTVIITAAFNDEESGPIEYTLHVH
jgi:hypothetical protein